MEIVVISDSHGNIANLKHVMAFALKIKCKAVIHCGDWDNLAAVEAVLVFGIPLYAVLGNADIDPEIAKIVNGQWLNIKLGKRKVGIVHNLAISPQPLAIDCDVVFCGHKHRQEESEEGGVKIVNPGALENNISFAIYDTGTNKVEFLGLKT